MTGSGQHIPRGIPQVLVRRLMYGFWNEGVSILVPVGSNDDDPPVVYFHFPKECLLGTKRWQSRGEPHFLGYLNQETRSAFNDEEMEDQRGQATCPRIPSWG